MELNCKSKIGRKMHLIVTFTLMLIFVTCFSVVVSAMQITVNKDNAVVKTLDVNPTDTVLSVKVKLLGEIKLLSIIRLKMEPACLYLSHPKNGLLWAIVV